MNKNKTYLLMTLCTIASLFLFYILNEMHRMRNEKNSLNTELQRKEEFINNNFKTGCLMDGLHAPDISYIEDNHEKKIAGLAKNKPVLICIYKNECSACGYGELNEIHDIFNDDSAMLYILCSVFIRRELYIYTRNHKINIPVFGLMSDPVNWIAEDYNKPFFFVLHPNLRISHIYFSDRQTPDLNKLYLEGVKRFLSDYDHETVLENNHSGNDDHDHSDH